MRTLLAFALALLSTIAVSQPHSAKMVERGKAYYPTITWAHDTAWPDSPMRSFTAAQIEKESLWNPDAELCVPKPTCSRERGLGLAQFTITPRFNAFTEVAELHPLLRGWRPEEYKDPKKQILAAVVKDRMHFRQCRPLMMGVEHQMACVASSYNGGHGGFLADRKLCSNTAGCNPQLWFGHVAETSTKAKAPLPGYGQSFFMINRGYSQALVHDYRSKYVEYLGN